VTVTAIAIENEVAQSGWYAQATYSILAQAAAPAISPAPGSYPVGQTVTITDANASATIRYTTDGSNPTTHSNWYHGPIKLTGAETINAIAIATGEAASPMATATFTTTGP
jgi:hypothetical protein